MSSGIFEKVVNSSVNNDMFFGFVNFEIINFNIVFVVDVFDKRGFVNNFDEFFVSVFVLVDLMNVMWGYVLFEGDRDGVVDIMELNGDVGNEGNLSVELVVDFMFVNVVS